MAARKRPASRGFVNNIILESLLDNDKYGYEIIKMVEEKSNGKIVLKQPSLYSSLKRFETKGYITSYWGDSDIGGRRHYYTLTETGKNYYQKILNKHNNYYEEDLKASGEVEDSTQEELEIHLVEANSELMLEENLDLKYEEQPIKDNVQTETPNVEDENYDVFSLLENDTNSNSTALKNNIENIKLDNELLINAKKDENTIQKIESNKQFNENSIQIDMFSNNKATTSTNQKEEQIDLKELNLLKNIEQKEIIKTEPLENKKSIPVIYEREQDFFSWEDLKRKQQFDNLNSKIEEESASNIKELNETNLKNTNALKNQIVMDESGIIKIDPIENKYEKKIFDNVGARIDYKDPVIKEIKKQANYEKELTEEEREIKNKNFNQKFNQIITDKNSTNSREEIDYKNILGDLLATEDNNLSIENTNIDNVEKDYISTQTVENAITKTEIINKNIAPNYDDGFKFKPYSTEKEDKKQTENYLLINKAKLNFGIFTFILMILQISTLFIILKATNLIYESDFTLFAIGYGISISMLLICIIPYFITSDKRKENNFKLTYSLIFGVLLFLATIALTYAICTFIGLNSLNVKLFATKLLLPIILAINFVLAPLIYKMVLQNKKLN